MNGLLVIIRGNSASGKTTLAKKIQNVFGYDKCLLLQQDTIRKEILHADDHKNTLAVNMIENLINFGIKDYPVTIVEGILRSDVYGEMLNKVVKDNKKNLIYYLDISFKTTVKYDQIKSKSFGEEKFKSWWRNKDYLCKNDIVLKNAKQYIYIKEIVSEIKRKL